MIPWLETDSPFPHPSTALTEKDGAAGLLAAGADLSAERLLYAYKNGIFPWFSDGQPILWWSTDPRMVLQVQDFKLSLSLKKRLRQVSKDPRWVVRFDTAFEDVMRACAAPRGEEHGTWISEDIVAGYCDLHKLGYAHSTEVWLDGELVGGAYGVCIGRMFYGESMFSRRSNASKVAFAHLIRQLTALGVGLIDCQMYTEHLASLGGREIPRALFIDHLQRLTAAPARRDAWLIESLDLNW